MNSSLTNFKDETGERLLEAGKLIKKQILPKKSQTFQTSQISQTPKTDKDPVTGKPVPSKKILTQLNQQVAQLAQMRIKKVREELAAQRLKVEKPPFARAVGGASEGQADKPKDDIIARVLKASKSTGEYGKNIGG